MFFFFSSRRRHTRFDCDWSSDVCSSDLSLKLRDAQTYVQSGNMIFRTDERDISRLAKRIEAGIERKFGFRPHAILRTTAEMKEVIARNPFVKRRGIEPSKLLVTFLASDPEIGRASCRERG